MGRVQVALLDSVVTRDSVRVTVTVEGQLPGLDLNVT